MPESPEEKAHRKIDANLTAGGWHVQDRDEVDLSAGQGIAVREFPMKTGFGFADYLLYVDRKVIGAVEARAGGTLTGVEPQSAKYAAGLPDNLPAHKRPLPFLFESNGSVIHFTNGLDPTPRSRQVFNFPRFEGRLVGQGPNDEPGSELIERIATERQRRARDPSAAKGGKMRAGRRSRRRTAAGSRRAV